MYTLYYTHDAKKDFKKIIKSNHKEICLQLLDLITQNPFQTPPPYKKLLGEHVGMYSRRINIQHRLFYEVDEKNKRIKILRMWNHYYDN
ncbi:addiction module toxin, Txe/YoeB family [Rickettsia felis str. Pedreira]|uniref:Putative mRNA interferase YoeB n=2 Tax=Rickettsia felis TaxID=42862 RepID=A0A0F3MQD2_RICFI|nr:Txe/YoeB family addiction module toxin [Rickettsia felis]AAY61341.1 Probable toxin of toxin-antitoxin system [Rickettsia felis URRWXCal2]KJV57993.1 addiction module toxin, Txe/YoeB family [Rickettsia felis str. Pedreira]MDE8611855.1 Txe/YoeB family addiction module toxin [Rickettsia felis]